MTQTRTTLKKGLKASLKREGKIKVSDSYPREDLQGKTLTIASKGTTICNGKGRCASDAHCIGLSVFVTDPQVPAASKKKQKDKKIGWRHGTVKICLTHLQDEKGVALIPLNVPLPARAKRSGKPPLPPQDHLAESLAESMRGGNGHSTIQGVTWQELAFAHQARDVDGLATYCRLLKTEHEKMALRLVNAQAKLLAGREAPSGIRSLQGVRGS